MTVILTQAWVLIPPGQGVDMGDQRGAVRFETTFLEVISQQFNEQDPSFHSRSIPQGSTALLCTRDRLFNSPVELSEHFS
jgi:hypothetical protein